MRCPGCLQIRDTCPGWLAVVPGQSALGARSSAQVAFGCIVGPKPAPPALPVSATPGPCPLASARGATGC
eukprot:1819646-Lingulodinium_polyedra.AAC.1